MRTPHKLSLATLVLLATTTSCSLASSPSAADESDRKSATKASNKSSLPAGERAVTAIDIAINPDATMLRCAKTANAELLQNYPDGFALDASHHPHITIVQRFVKTADLEK